MKAIVIGPSLSGKTTLVRYFRAHTSCVVGEIDEELTRKNSDVYPSDSKYKHEILAPEIVEEILRGDNLIFFTNTDYFTSENLKDAREKGFKIIQLSLPLEELQKRNSERIHNEGYKDLSKWFEGMLHYQETMKELGLVDKTINADQSPEKIAAELLASMG